MLPTSELPSILGFGEGVTALPRAEEPSCATTADRGQQNESGPDAGEAFHLRAGGSHGGVCALLVPFLLYLHPARYLQRQLLHPWRTFQPFLLDWLLQQLSEPNNLHYFQQGFQEILQENHLQNF